MAVGGGNDITIDLVLNGTSFAVEIRNATQLLVSFGRILAAAATQGGGMQGMLRALAAQLRLLGGAAGGASGNLRNMHGALNGLWSRLRDISVVGYGAVGIFQMLKSVLYDWQMAIVDTNARIEKLTALLAGLSKEADLGARFAEAKKDLASMFDLAEKAPFSIEELTKAFVKFKAVNLDDPLRAINAITNAVANFGGSEIEIHRASVAIQQMAGKGVISMEELRQQLGEAVPNAINIMAREMGMSYFKFVDAVSKGTVEAQTGLNAMFRGMEKDFGGSAERMMSTWNGMVSKLKTRWIKFQLEIGGEDGFFKEAKESLGELIDLLDTPAMKQFGRDMGEWMAASLRTLKELIVLIVENREHLLALTEIAMGFFGVWVGTKIINATFRMITTGLTAIRGGLLAINYLAGMNPWFRGFSMLATAIGVAATALFGYSRMAQAAEQKQKRLNKEIADAAGDTQAYADVVKEPVERTAMQAAVDTGAAAQQASVFDEYRIAFDKMSERINSFFAENRIGEFFARWYELNKKALVDFIAGFDGLGPALLKAFAEFPTNMEKMGVIIAFWLNVWWEKFKEFFRNVGTLGDSFQNVLYKMTPNFLLTEGDHESQAKRDKAAKERKEDPTGHDAEYDRNYSALLDAADETIKGIDTETEARKKLLHETDANSNAARDNARAAEAAAAAHKDLEGAALVAATAMERESQRFREGMRDMNMGIEATQKSWDSLVPGTSELKSYNEQIATNAKVFEGAGKVIQETANANDMLARAMQGVAAAQETLSKRTTGLDVGSNEYKQAVADYVGVMKALNTEIGVQKTRLKASEGAWDNVNAAIERMDAHLPMLKNKLYEAVGKAPSPEALQYLEKMNVSLEQLFRTAEKQFKLPAGILSGLKAVESKPGATAETRGEPIKKGMHKGDRAIGILQMMPKTARDLGLDPEKDLRTLTQQVWASALLMAKNMATLKTDDPALLYGAYHAGAGAVKDAGMQVPNTSDGYMNTRDYAAKAVSVQRAVLGDTTGADGVDAAEQLAELDELNRKKLDQERKLTNDLTSLWGERASKQGQLVIAANIKIDDINNDVMLSEEQRAAKILAIRAKLNDELINLNREEATKYNEFAAETAQIRLSMLTEEKDMEARIRGEAMLEAQRIGAMADVDAKLRADRIVAIWEKAEKDILDEHRKTVTAMADSIGQAIGDAFGSLARGGESAKETLRRLIEALRDMVIQLLIIEPLAKAIANAIKGGGSAGGGGGWMDMVSGLMTTGIMGLFGGGISLGGGGKAPAVGSTAGGLVNAGDYIVKLANGGVMNTHLPHGIYTEPTTFPLEDVGLHRFANGTGMLAEAGRAEAILPLERIGADLGVKAAMAPMTVIVNNNAPGVDVRTQQNEGGLTLEIVRAALAEDFMRGGSSVARAAESAYPGLRRGR